MLKFISTFMLAAIIGVVGYHFYDYKDGGSLFSSTTLASVQEIEHQEFEDAVLYQENREISTLEVLATQHKYLNNVTGWGGADTVDLRNLKTSDEWKELKAAVNWMKTEGFAPSKVWNDMENANGLIMLVERNDDRLALKYLHRIFHDLDVTLNEITEDEGETNVWGVTHALGNNREIRRINNHLKKNF